MQEFPDGGHWKGLNYVFDKREAIGVDSVHGVGGVVEGKKKKKKKKKKTKGAKEGIDDGKILGKCCTCGDNWERCVLSTVVLPRCTRCTRQSAR
jgi:predicted sulfurtransferase